MRVALSPWLVVGLLWLGVVWGSGSTTVAAGLIVQLKNGDRISGELLSEAPDRVVLKSTVLGRIEIPVAEIDQRIAPAAAKPGLTNGPTNASPVVAAAPVAPPKPPPTPTPPVAKISTNTPIYWAFFPGWARPLLTNWHGNIQLGMDLGFGTTDRKTFYANAGLKHAYNRFRNDISLRSAYGIADTPVSVAAPSGTVQTANSLEGLWKTDFDLGVRRKIYLYHQTGAGFDEIRRYDLRFEDGAGLGYKLIEHTNLTLNLETGGQYQHLAYLNGPAFLPYLPDHDTFSARLGENLTWKTASKLTFTQRLQITPNVQDFGDFRARLDLSISYPLLKRVTLSLNLFDEYESRPAAQVDKNQLQIQSTLGVTF